MQTAARIGGPGTAGLHQGLGGTAGWLDVIQLAGLGVLVGVGIGGLAWVLLDSRRRPAPRAAQAAYLALGCIPLVGPLLYRLLRPLELHGERRLRELELALLAAAVGRTPACPACGHSVRPDFMACPQCGERLRSRCEACAGALEPGWAACPFCGTAHESRLPGRLEPRTAAARGS